MLAIAKFSAVVSDASDIDVKPPAKKVAVQKSKPAPKAKIITKMDLDDSDDDGRFGVRSSGMRSDSSLQHSSSEGDWQSSSEGEAEDKAQRRDSG